VLRVPVLRNLCRRNTTPWVLSLLLVLAAGAAPASAQEWHEAYRDGVRALSQGQAARAVSLLEYAVSRRPQPGRDIVTYGTNVERQYYPYVKLADAYLQLQNLEGARSASKRSETWAREPPEERKRIAAAIEALALKLAPAPAPTTAPTAAAVATAPTPPAPVATPIVVADSPAPLVPNSTPEARTTIAVPGARGAIPSPHPRDVAGAVPPPTPAAAARPAVGSIDIVSQPPGASVYLDDELIGTTDPEWGRLTRNGITAGRHHVRLALPAYADSTEDMDVAPGGRTELRRRLQPSTAAAAAGDHRFLLIGGVALVLLGATAWALRRPAAMARATTAPGLPFDPSAATPARITPAGLGNPGAHKGADGRDYFGEYRLLGPLGRGGMASVYRAERGTDVYALKRPLPAFLEEPEFLERFLREAEIGRTLHHPNIVRILERGEVGGVPFFTMELVPGETLQSLLQRVKFLEPRPATQLIVQIAEALDYAHLKGVVHRDLKPSNVMVLPDGLAKVMDYGIARARRFDGLTVTGAFLGSPEYVAPETIEARGTDARSDLYSLGVLFYETLAGRRPFVADSPFAILNKHLTEDPPAPSTLRPGVPAELDRIVLRLLSKAPAARYAAAEDLVLDLRDFLNRAA
jgi:hypothetical protein